MPVYFSTHNKILTHFRVFKQSCQNIDNSLAVDHVTCNQKRQMLLCLEESLFWRAATHQSHWRSSAPWCCLLSAHCHREDKPLALRRQNKLIFTKGYEIMKTECHVISFSGQISCYLTAVVCSVSVLPEPRRKLWSSINGLPCTSETGQGQFAVVWIHTPADRLMFAPQSLSTSCFFILLLVYFGAGSVVAMQKGKRRSWVKSESVPWHRQHLECTASCTLWNSVGRPKQQIQMIFNSEFLVMPALL